jgi:hypothetical protein
MEQAKCDTCGKSTNLPVTICGQCAEDWNESASGMARINRRRKTHGLEPIIRHGEPFSAHNPRKNPV